GHISEVQPTVSLSANESAGLPRVSVDLDFLEDDDILGGSPGGEGGSNGIGTNHEPCDILQQSLAEANITEQSLQEAEAELDLGSFGIPGLTQVVQTLPDASLAGAGSAAVGVGIGGPAAIFPGSVPSTTSTPPNATADMLGSVLAQQGLQLQHPVVNKAISVQPFVQQVGLGNVTIQPISSLQALSNGNQSGHLGIGQIQVVGQPTVMTINQSGQPILAKAMGGYQLHQSGAEMSGAGSQTGLGGTGGGLLIQGNKATLSSPALNGPAVCVSSANSSGGTMTVPSGLVGFGSTPLSSGVTSQVQTQGGQIMQNVIIQRTPTPIQPKPPQGGPIQPKLFKQQPQQPSPVPQTLQNDAHKALGIQQLPVSAAQNVTFLTGKPGSNVVLSTQATTQGPQFQQSLFKQQGPQPSGKPLSVHLLNQPSSFVIPSQTVLQGQNHQFLLPQLQAGGQILTQHPGGHIITSQGPGGQIIANQILTANQNINLGQVLTSQGSSGATHILSGPIQLQSGQMAAPALFQMPVASLAQSQGQTQTHTVSGAAQTVIQGMPIQNPLTMLGQVEGLSPAVSLQPALQPQSGGVPSSTGAGTVGQGQPGEAVAVLGGSADAAAHPTQQLLPQSSILTIQQASSVSSASTVPTSSPSISVSTTSSVTAVGLAPHQAQHSPGRLLFTNQGQSMILSQESLQMFLQQEHRHQTESTPSVGVPASVIISSNSISTAAPAVHDSQLAESPPGPSHMTAVVKVPSSAAQQPLKIQGMSPSLTSHPTTPPVAESPQPSQSPLVLSQQIQSPHHQQRPPSQPQPQSQTPSRSCTPSSHPSLFIVPSQVAESPKPVPQVQTQQTPPQQQHIQLQLQPLPRPPSLPAPYQQERPSMSQSPKPTPAPAAAQHPFPPPPASACAPAVVKTQIPMQGFTAVHQQQLQLVGAQIQTLSSITQPSPQQKQLLEKLHQQPKPGVISSVGGMTLGKGGVKIQVLGATLTQMPAPQPPPPVQTQTTTMPFGAEPSKEAMLEQLRKHQGSVLHPNYSSPFHSFEDTLNRLLPYHLYQGTANSSQDYQRDDEFENVSCQLLKRTQAMVDKYRHLLFAESKRLGPSAEMVMIDRMFIQEEKIALSSDRAMAKDKPAEEFLASVRMLESVSVPTEPPSVSGVAPIDPPVQAPVAPVSASPSLNVAPNPPPASASAPVQAPAPVPASTPTPPFPTKLVIKHGGGGASVSWSTSCPSVAPAKPASDPVSQSFSRAPTLSSSSSSSSLPSASSNSQEADDDDDVALPQRTSKPPIKTYEARRRIGLKLKIKQDQTGFSKVVHNTALDPVHTLQPQPSNQATPPPQAPPQSEAAVAADAKPHPLSSPLTTVIRTQSHACTASSGFSVSMTTTQSNPPLRGTASSGGAPSSSSSSSSSSHSWPSSTSSSSTQVNGTLDHHSVGGVKHNPASAPTPSQTTCRLPLRKTYRENVSPCVRPGVPGGGDEGLSYPRATPSPPRHGASTPPSERTVIASVKADKKDREASRPHTESGHEAGHFGGAVQGLDKINEVFNHGIKTTQHHHHPLLLDREGAKEGRADQEVEVRKYKRLGGKNKHMTGGTFRMDQHAPGPPSPESSYPRDSLLPAKRCKSDSPDMDNASFSSGSPPDDSLNEHLQCAIDSILNLQQEPSGRHIKGGGSRPHQRQSQRAGDLAASSHRPSLPPASSASSSSALAQHPQVGGRGHNGSLVPQTQSR
uniref:BRD4 interacting chromatin remodeling complex associated protein n=1 Tax=Oryzias latipes TaxID=8090 RepID=A0A3P9MGC7_ORYLA